MGLRAAHKSEYIGFDLLIVRERKGATYKNYLTGVLHPQILSPNPGFLNQNSKVGGVDAGNGTCVQHAAQAVLIMGNECR